MTDTFTFCTSKAAAAKKSPHRMLKPVHASMIMNLRDGRISRHSVS